jgi:ferredoxin--NADP+ reductase
MPDADVVVCPEEIALDPASEAALAVLEHRHTAERNMETLRAFAVQPRAGRRRTIHLRFLCSPIEISGSGRVERLVIGKNRLVQGSTGGLRAEPTGERETLDVGLVFRSVGYLGTGVPGLPLDAQRGIIPNTRGRVLENGATVQGEYVAGWIKRGPTGVVGTNKPDAAESADLLLEDFKAGRLPAPAEGQSIAARRPGSSGRDRADWQRLEKSSERGAPRASLFPFTRRTICRGAEADIAVGPTSPPGWPASRMRDDRPR